MAAPDSIRVRCPAKINLGLWILGRREDGYHEVDTILQTVALEDELTLEPVPQGFSVETQGIPIPHNGPNLVERAWNLISERATGSKFRGIRARLTKRIPIGAGLGGGSSDAAGFLAGVNHLLELGLTKTELHSLGARLGSDVPFFFEGGTARATGRGEKVRQLCPIEPFWVVLASPPIAIPTTWAYGRIRFHLTPERSGANLLASAIGSREWGAVADAMHNVFEDVVLPDFPSLAELKRSLIGLGAMKALMSGSGSTLYGVARSFDEAMRAAKGIAGRGAEVRVVRTLERGVHVARRA
ncbi:MAG TPA: 4-(cytidine 5'-diphospho)-2-C-methyl-D-erythritol kinase [Candidatus Eisenbacteria bacterium]|nr:4-(cytidine 5'-diphospho)-2-C-methyl-D-erythritol kinase [Candidatus Eisenbacteria bacterium]